MSYGASLGPRVPAPTLTIERNELSQKAMGGTELMQLGLTRNVDNELLKNFQIICSRVRDIDPNRIPILWCHDLAEDPEVARLRDPNFRNQFARIVFVSHWQRDRYIKHLGIPAEPNQVVIKNFIDPLPTGPKPKGNEKVKLIYHSTPHRGLEILVPVVEALWGVRQDFELDVYSSFKLYGWEQRDAPYAELFDRCRNHPAINYHGAVPNSEIRKALSSSEIFAYPSIWQETSCICAIEAMSAGNKVVCSSLGALPETTGNFAYMYAYTDDLAAHASRFASVLSNVMDYTKAMRNTPLTSQKQWIDGVNGWEVGSRLWTGILKEILHSR